MNPEIDRTPEGFLNPSGVTREQYQFRQNATIKDVSPNEVFRLAGFPRLGLSLINATLAATKRRYRDEMLDGFFPAILPYRDKLVTDGLYGTALAEFMPNSKTINDIHEYASYGYWSPDKSCDMCGKHIHALNDSGYHLCIECDRVNSLQINGTADHWPAIPDE